MKIQTIHSSHNAVTFRPPVTGSGNRITRHAVALFTAAVAGAGVILLGTLAVAQPHLQEAATVSMWVAGLIFLALAVEASAQRVWPMVVTGLVLSSLGYFSHRLAEEWAIVGATVIAAWVARAVWLHQHRA